MTKVTLEIGHGPYRTRAGKTGFEEGATGPGTTEYKEVVVMSTIASELLKEKGYQVEISDPPSTLPEIGKKAAGSDIFVSLHLNAFDKEVQGTEVLVDRSATDEDVVLAQVLQRFLVDALGLTDRKVKRQGLAVLRAVPVTVRAACLTEAFFIDSVSDAKTVRAMAEKAAKAIAEGIDEYARVKGLQPVATATA